MNLAESYKILSDVLLDGEYVHLAFRSVDADGGDKAWNRKLVYGVLEHYYQLNAVVDALSAKPPKPRIRVLLLQAAYCLMYLDEPAYAVVNEAVNFCRKRHLGAEGYVNALLKRVAARDFTLPTQGEKGEEIRFNLPYWMIRRVQSDYPDCWEQILSAPVREEEHIRLRTGTNAAAFVKRFPDAVPTATGYYHRMTPALSALFERGLVTVQGYNSTLAITAFGDLKGKRFLDVAAAPGGKSVYAAELGANVTACDVHPHRVDLIRSYAKRMGVKLRAEVRDGTRFNPQWEGAFDCVLVDAPCSGLGVVNRRRDSVFRREEREIAALHALQVKLLQNAARYVRDGGTLVYSTCTVLKEENEGSASVLGALGFTPAPLPFADGACQKTFLPHTDGEGFYIAKFIKRT